ncbi:MAG: type II 3-dehydroquinate dehydratase [Methylocystaceae bacterium]
MRILVINGPNLNLLGERQPEIYGGVKLAEIEAQMQLAGTEAGVELGFYQSNHEGDLIDAIQTARHDYDGIIINAGAYTHYSLALHDALMSVRLPAIEVHLSNIYAREEQRRHSVIAPATVGGIYGFGANGYLLALQGLINRLGKDVDSKS